LYKNVDRHKVAQTADVVGKNNDNNINLKPVFDSLANLSQAAVARNHLRPK